MSEPPCPLFHPEKTELLPPSIPRFLAPISLRLRSALIRPCSHAGEMTEGREREGEREGRKRRHGGEGGEKEMTALQQVWRIGSEGKGRVLF